MASRLDDLLNSVVNRLQSLGVGRTQRQPEQVPYGFRPYEGSQNLATERLVNIGGKTYIGPKQQPPRQDYSGDRYYGLPERNIVQADRPAYTATPMSMSGGLFGATQGPVTVADTIRGAIPEPLTPEREAELRRMQEKRLPGEEADLRGINLNPDYDNPFFILPERNPSAVADGTVLAGAGRTGELSALDTDYANQTAGNPLKIFEPLFRTTEGYQDRMTDSERRRKADIEAGTSKRRGLFTSTEEAAAAYKRKKARDDLMQYGGSDMPYQGQAADNATRDAILEYGGGEMPYQGQNIEIDPIVLEIPEQPTNEEIIRALEQDYADLAAAGADTATLSALAREIDSYRDRQSSLPSIVSEAAASDVIENAPVNYDAFGNVIAQPETEVLMSRQAQVVDPVEMQTETLFKGQLGRLGFDTPQARERLNDLAQKIAMIESSGNPQAKNIPVKGKKASSATGLYQFLVDTSGGQSALQTAVNRTKKYVKADWLDEVARTGKVEDLSPEQQTILFLGDILEKKGSDQYLKKLLDPNASKEEINKAMLDIYSKLHHTNVDERTLNRAKKFIK